MNVLEVLAHKRDGLEHSPEEIRFLLYGYLGGSIPDYQVSAWLMAVVTRGMTRAETLSLTNAMVASGEVLDLSAIPGFKVDKHSNIHFIVGKASFTADQLNENITAALDEIVRVKPSSSKGRYIMKGAVSTTFGPGIPLDVTVI